MAIQIENIYKNILNDPRVRAAVDSIARHFPRAPFVAIVVGSLAGLVKSALKGKPIAPGDISGIFQLLGAAVSGGLPPLVVGTMVDGVVRSVRATKGSKQAKELGEGRERKDVEVVRTEGKSVNDGAGGEELVALNGASAVVVPLITATVEGSDLAGE
ncbi:hypothetical protein FRC09_010778, partial [Ceratobasidium sp. 395]